MMIKRRNFLRNGVLGMGALALQSSSLATRLMAATPKDSSSPYKALVCINLNGGNDGNNTIVPMSSTAYGAYNTARQQIALTQSSLLPVGDGRNEMYGLHPSLVNLQKRYLSGQAAFVANVGPLLTPLDRTSYITQAKPVPSYLMDHELQRAEWGTSYALVQPSAPGQTGWGGRIADLMQATNTSSYPLVTSVTGADPFSNGVTSIAANVSPTSSTGFPTDGSDAALQLIANLHSCCKLVGAAASGLNDAMNQSALINSALLAAPTFKTVFPQTSIGAQFQQIARIMSVRSTLGMNRQIFVCEQMNFDTHGAQLYIQGTALVQLDQAIEAFMECLDEIGLADQVVLFTQSDFGRSLMMNNSGGSDHAWGNHQLVIGGAIRGNRILGQFPDLTLGGPNDCFTNGVWIPTTSVEQYGSPLASWFGVPAQSMPVVFPNIGAFAQNTIPIFG